MQCNTSQYCTVQFGPVQCKKTKLYRRQKNYQYVTCSHSPSPLLYCFFLFSSSLLFVSSSFPAFISSLFFFLFSPSSPLHLSIAGPSTPATPLAHRGTYCVEQSTPSCPKVASTQRPPSSLLATCLLCPDKVQCSLSPSLYFSLSFSFPPSLTYFTFSMSISFFLYLPPSLSLSLPPSLPYFLKLPLSPTNSLPPFWHFSFPPSFHSRHLFLSCNLTHITPPLH